MELSLVIVHYRDAERLLALLRRLPQALAGLEAEVIVIDNASGDPELARAVTAALPIVRFVANDRNVGFGAGMNQGVRLATGANVALVNPDVELENGFFRPLLERLQADPTVGAVGPMVLRPGGRFQLTAHRRFPNHATVFTEYCLPLQVLLSRWLSPLHPHDESVAAHRRSHRTAHLTAVCLLTKRDVFLASGGFDERFFLYLEETDWQRRLAERGMAIWYCAEARLVHFGSVGKRFAQATPEYLASLDRYWSKWWGVRARWRLRPAVFLAALVSLVSLLPLVALAPWIRNGWRKLQRYGAGYAAILAWSLRRPPTL